MIIAGEKLKREREREMCSQFKNGRSSSFKKDKHGHFGNYYWWQTLPSCA